MAVLLTCLTVFRGLVSRDCLSHQFGKVWKRLCPVPWGGTSRNFSICVPAANLIRFSSQDRLLCLQEGVHLPLIAQRTWLVLCSERSLGMPIHFKPVYLCPCLLSFICAQRQVVGHHTVCGLSAGNLAVRDEMIAPMKAPECITPLCNAGWLRRCWCQSYPWPS